MLLASPMAREGRGGRCIMVEAGTGKGAQPRRCRTNVAYVSTTFSAKLPTRLARHRLSGEWLVYGIDEHHDRAKMSPGCISKPAVDKTLPASPIVDVPSGRNREAASLHHSITTAPKQLPVRWPGICHQHVENSGHTKARDEVSTGPMACKTLALQRSTAGRREDIGQPTPVLATASNRRNERILIKEPTETQMLC